MRRNPIWLVVTGNYTDGFEVSGPFSEPEYCEMWANHNLEQGTEWSVATLDSPELPNEQM